MTLFYLTWFLDREKFQTSAALFLYSKAHYVPALVIRNKRQVP